MTYDDCGNDWTHIRTRRRPLYTLFRLEATHYRLTVTHRPIMTLPARLARLLPSVVFFRYLLTMTD